MISRFRPSRTATTNLRLTSGRFRGIQLSSPGSSATHPMGSREKLALFNMIRPYLSGAEVLDAYAGSGALGLEALSQGAHSVVFVDRDERACETIMLNIGKVAPHLDSVSAALRVHCQSITDFVRSHSESSFDLILADPPYDHFSAAEVALLVPLLRPDGVLALSFPAAFAPPELPGLTLLKSRHYAAAGVGVYRKDT